MLRPIRTRRLASWDLRALPQEIKATMIAAARTGRWAIRPLWPGFGEPLNGQRLRQRVVDELIRDFEPHAIIETGTFLGFSTRWFARYGVQVHTAEIDPGLFNLARLRLARVQGVSLVLGDSAQALTHLASELLDARPFLYLDAHWGDRLPLQDEVNIAFSAWDDTLVVIDDFRVEIDDGFDYDIYDGRALSLRNLSLPAGVAAAFPAEAAPQETGARRGTLYLARGPRAESALDRAADHGRLARAVPSVPSA